MMSQERFHVTREQLEQLAEDRLSPGVRRAVVRHLATGCVDCRSLANSLFGGQSDYSSVFRSLSLRSPVSQASLGAERQLAEVLWNERLRSAEAGQRLLYARTDSNFWCWGLYEKIHNLSKERRKDYPLEALDLAHLALEIAERLPVDRYPPSLINDARAAACGTIGNCKRILGDLAGCGEALDLAAEWLEEGTGDPLEESNLVSLRVSWLAELGRLEEAEELLETALECARQVRDPQLEGRLLIQMASMAAFHDPARGLERAYRALALLNPGVDRELDLIGRYLVMLLHCELGNLQEAKALFNAFSEDFAGQDNAFWRGKLLQFEAAMARKEGDFDRAESLFRKQVDLFGQHDMRLDLTLAALDLAEVLTAKHEFLEAFKILEAVYPILEGWGAGREVLRAWLMVQEAVRVESLEAATFKEATSTLRRYWGKR